METIFFSPRKERRENFLFSFASVRAAKEKQSACEYLSLFIYRPLNGK
jgi:hypothetical protein